MGQEVRDIPCQPRRPSRDQVPVPSERNRGKEQGQQHGINVTS
jgi:hypothetical protein